MLNMTTTIIIIIIIIIKKKKSDLLAQLPWQHLTFHTTQEES
jgi:hypothetical protein